MKGLFQNGQEEISISLYDWLARQIAKRLDLLIERRVARLSLQATCQAEQKKLLAVESAFGAAAIMRFMDLPLFQPKLKIDSCM